MCRLAIIRAESNLGDLNMKKMTIYQLTVTALLAAVLAEYEVTAEQAGADIADFLEQLRAAGCLEE